MSWGAIIAGTLLALALQFMLGLLGLGIGLSTVDATTADGTPSVSTFASASGLWAIAVVLIGLFFGAFAAGRLAGSPTRMDAALHGIVTWATSTLLVLYLLTSGASAVIGGAFGALGGSIQSLASAASSVTPQSLDTLPEPLKSQAQQLLQKGADQAQQAGDQLQDQAQQATGQEDLSGAISTIVAGLGENATPDQRNAATQVIAQQAGIPQQEAEQRLQEFQQKYDAAMQKARQAADDAAQTVSTASFGAFVAMLLGLVVGAIGGLVGAPKRVY